MKYAAKIKFCNNIEKINSLIKNLKDPDVDIQSKAEQGLSSRKDIETVNLLLPYLKDKNKKFRWVIIRILGRIKTPDKCKVLIDAFKDKNPDIRAAIVRVIAKMDDKKNINFLKKALKDEHARVRTAVIDDSRWVKHKYGYEILVYALRDKNQTVRECAAESLHSFKINDGRLAKLILNALKNRARFFSSYLLSSYLKSGLKVLRRLNKPAAGVFISGLKNPDWRIRTASAAALVTNKDTRIVKPLINALKDKRREVRTWARVALAEMGAPVVMPLIDALKKKDFYTKRDISINDKAIGHISWTLIELGPAAVKPLINALRDTSINLRSAAVLALGEMRCSEAVNPIIERLKDKNKKVRLNAIISLGKLRDTRAVESLIRSLEENNPMLRREAVETLGKIKDKRAVTPLIQMLKDTDSKVKWWAAWALGEIQDRRAITPLVELLRDKNIDTGSCCIGIGGPSHALGEFKDPRVVKDLIIALKHPNWEVRSRAAWALGEIKDRRAVNPLLAILSKENTDINHFYVAEALGKIKDKTAFRPLIKAARSKNCQLRMGAAEALGQFKDSRAVKHLLILLKDKDYYIRSHAAEALGKIKDIRAIGPLLELARNGSDWDKSSAIKSLKCFGRLAIRHLLDLLKNNPDLDSRIFEALAEIGKPAIKPLVSIVDERRGRYFSAIEALGKIKDRRTMNVLLTELKKRVNLKDTIARALLNFVDHHIVRKEFLCALKKKDLQIIAGAYPYFIRKGVRGTEGILIQTLHKYGDVDMLDDFFYSGNIKLSSAALSCGRQNGFCLRVGNVSRSRLLASIFGERDKTFSWGEGYYLKKA